METDMEDAEKGVARRAFQLKRWHMMAFAGGGVLRVYNTYGIRRIEVWQR
jgi:hypothetical protein